jgi:hypothetical protein
MAISIFIFITSALSSFSKAAFASAVVRRAGEETQNHVQENLKHLTFEYKNRIMTHGWADDEKIVEHAAPQQPLPAEITLIDASSYHYREETPPLNFIEKSTTCNTNTWASNIVCNNIDPPSVAMCIAGTARTLTQPLVHRTLKTNLIEGFGGNPTLFAAVKTADQRGDTRKKFGGLIDSDQTAVERVLRELGVADINMMVVKDGFPSDRMPPISCGYHNGSDREVDLLRSLVGQLNGKVACNSLILEHEKRQDPSNRWKFDYVIALRPDLSWPQAMKPYCFWDLSKNYRKWDWVFMMTRNQAAQHLEMNPDNFFSCKVTGEVHSEPEEYLMEGFVGAGTGIGDKWITGFLTRQNAADMPHNLCSFNDDLFPEVKGHWTAQKHVCEKATHQNKCVNT